MSAEQMDDRCPGATFAGLARLDNYRFLINQRGVATVEPHVDGVVRGVLWNALEDHIDTLDGYEGVAKGNYTREVMPVMVESNGSAVDSIVYVDRRNRPGPALDGYLETVIEGARDFALPDAYINELETWFKPGRE